MASEYTTILPTDSAATIKRKRAIQKLENMKEAAIELNLWTDNQEKQLKTLKNELDTGQILPTKIDEGGITNIEKKEGESWGDWFKGLFSEADVPDEELIQLAKGVTYKDPEEEEYFRKLQEEQGYIWTGVGRDSPPTTTRDEWDLELRMDTLSDEGQQLYKMYLNKYPNADKEKVMNTLQRDYTDTQRKKETENWWGVDIAKNIGRKLKQFSPISSAASGHTPAVRPAIVEC